MSDRAYYDQEVEISTTGHEGWMREIEHYFQGYAERMNDALAGTRGYVAELGAGSCGLSACLSRLQNVRQVAALDISQLRMRRMVRLSAKVLGGNMEKISPIVSDFNCGLPFKNGELDAIVFDASLHHARSMWATLSECRRVLRGGGLLVAQREAYLNPLRATGQIKRLLETPEVAASVSENIYLREQYIYYLTVHGFGVEFIPRSTGSLKNLLIPLNGMLFSDGILYASKTDIR